MAMLEKSTLNVNLGTTNTSPANRILAASSSVARWIRGITVVNNGGAGSWNFGVGTGAVLTAANSIWFGIPIAAGATFVHYFPGRGLRLNTPATDEVMAFASAANMTLEVSYSEQDLT
jgi:hypothetical protein